MLRSAPTRERVYRKTEGANSLVKGLKGTASEGKCLKFILPSCQFRGRGQERDLSSIFFGIFAKATRKKITV